MKLAITAKDKEWDSEIEPRFGRTPYFIIIENDEITTVLDNSEATISEHGAGNKAVQLLVDNNVTHVITCNGPGGNAGSVLRRLGIEVYLSENNISIREAYKNYKDNKLKKMNL